ncbi:hypothetical protein BH11PSE10_BH11PSE10_06860 [soil metagenome]
MTEIRDRTVLFADLRGSTALFETLGNAEATALVTQTVSLIGQAVSDGNGRIVKTLGDGLMAVFEAPRDGVKAAIRMHELLARSSARGKQLAMRALRMQVALARGEVVEMAGDCFGDAVNVSARLLDHAGDNETLITTEVLGGLTPSQKSRFRSLDLIAIRGRAEPVHVHVLDQPNQGQHGDMAATQFGELVQAVEPDGIRLIWLDLDRVFDIDSLPIVLGRSVQATYCITDGRVSRSHARIDWHGGTFSLTDLSYNGTFVRFSGDGEIVSLKRGGCTLHGSGLIGLGSPPNDIASPTVRFEVLHFVETLPQPLAALRPKR